MRTSTGNYEFFDKLVISPNIIKHDKRNDPPADTKGKGSPFTGIKPTVIAELTNRWDKNIEVKPIITMLEK